MFYKITLSSLLLMSSSLAVATNKIHCHDIDGTNVKQCELIGSSGAATVYGIAPMPYALCSQARCKLSADKSTAQCACDLVTSVQGWKGFSLSPVSYQSAKPSYDLHKQLQSVQSNYSMANLTQFGQPVNQTCSYKKPQYWADCYGVRCNINSASSAGSVACTCPVKKNKKFMIGVRDKEACNVSDAAIWSATQGQSMKDFGGNPMMILYKKVYPGSPPAVSAD